MAGSLPSSSPQNPRYTLPNDWDFANERLALLGAAYDPQSIALARQLGVGPGWRCLEAGAGGGSFARWLCSATSPGGRVLAVDADPRHLADLPDRGGEVAQIDLAADELPERAFDFVHTRFVLLHIAQRDVVLDDWRARSRRAAFSCSRKATGSACSTKCRARSGRSGGPSHGPPRSRARTRAWARDLPTSWRELGLVDVESDAEISDVPRRFADGAHVESYVGTGPRKAWIAHRRLARGLLRPRRRSSTDEQRWFYAPLTVRAWARAPQWPVARLSDAHGETQEAQ